MARKYDRMIRFYGSWFADLNDPEKELTAEERWLVVEAIVQCQEQESTEPLQLLPLTIRRALSMATMREQLERVLERNQGARERGRKGAQERYKDSGVVPQPPSLFDGQEVELTPPADGIERNWDGLLDWLHEWEIPGTMISQIAKYSNFGQIGSWIWKAVTCIRTKHVKDKESYLMKCIQEFQK